MNTNKWREWRLSALIEAEDAEKKEKKEKKEKQEKEEDVPEIGVSKAKKPGTDNEGKREVVDVNGKRFYLDMDNVTSRTGHTLSWVELVALYEYGKENKFIKK
jgi:hypothetical protein